MLCKNDTYVFCRAKQALFDVKLFGQHLLTKLLPKIGCFLKIPLKIGLIRGGDKSMGGFRLLGVGGPIFWRAGAQSVLSTTPKQFYHILHASSCNSL